MPARPNEGTLRFNVEYSPMASPEFGGGRPSEGAMEMVRLLEQVLRNSRAVDREALCVLAGHKVCISYPYQEQLLWSYSSRGTAEMTCHDLTSVLGE